MTTQLHQRLTETLRANGVEPTQKLVAALARAAKPERPVTDQQRAVNALLSVTGWPSATMYRRAATLAKALAQDSDYSTVAADIENYYGQHVNGQAWQWWRDDWRGRDKHQRPDESGIRQTWKAWTNANAKAGIRQDDSEATRIARALSAG